jgi:gamma-glutamylcyclotransferase (GGCT)/AIG2-like uncharacterized protein YtfP
MDLVVRAFVFVYGTLRPGDCRWHFLEPFVGDGWADSAPGRIFDTGLDYPAAVFGGEGTILGHTFELLATTAAEALDVLDEVEGVVEGEYRRVAIRTAAGRTAWAYEYGGGLELRPIVSGDWFLHRPPSDRSREQLHE